MQCIYRSFNERIYEVNIDFRPACRGLDTIARHVIIETVFFDVLHDFWLGIVREKIFATTFDELREFGKNAQEFGVNFIDESEIERANMQHPQFDEVRSKIVANFFKHFFRRVTDQLTAEVDQN